MGTQTMGSNRGGGISRQGSLYNLTLDEVQQQLGDLGKPLTSMNLDELLKSVWTAEGKEGTSSASPAGPGAPGAGTGAGPGALSEISKKTVDEVWQGIQEGQKTSRSDIRKERQGTLGEMTLEDFLVKAGVVTEGLPEKKEMEVEVDPQWMMQYQMRMAQQQQQMVGGYVGNVGMEVGFPDTRMTMSQSPLMGSLSDAHLSGRKRFASGAVVEKTVERRQKRMIKNRESAARSRARKQAYTQELENKISRLEEENERLRRQKEVEKVLPCVPPPEPKYQLRRTTSAPF